MVPEGISHNGDAGMKIFVAGAGGYIGLPLCRELWASGHEVVAFDTWWFSKTPEPDGYAQIVSGDIRTVEEMDLEGVGCVIDLAGLSNDAAGDISPELTDAINVRGAKRLIDMAKRAGVRKYVYSSSASVYGSNDDQRLTVEAECNPQTAYARSKVEVEDYLRKVAARDFEAVILRNGTVYGPSQRMRFDLVVNRMVRDAVMDHTIHIGGRGDQWRPFIHIADLVTVFSEAADSWGPGTFNVATENYQIAAIAGMVMAKLGGCLVKWHSPPDPTDKRSYNISTLGWQRRWRVVYDGIADVDNALRDGTITAEDPKAWTVNWYKTLPEFQPYLRAP